MHFNLWVALGVITVLVLASVMYKARLRRKQRAFLVHKRYIGEIFKRRLSPAEDNPWVWQCMKAGSPAELTKWLCSLVPEEPRYADDVLAIKACESVQAHNWRIHHAREVLGMTETNVTQRKTTISTSRIRRPAFKQTQPVYVDDCADTIGPTTINDCAEALACFMQRFPSQTPSPMSCHEIVTVTNCSSAHEQEYVCPPDIVQADHHALNDVSPDESSDDSDDDSENDS